MRNIPNLDAEQHELLFDLVGYTIRNNNDFKNEIISMLEIYLSDHYSHEIEDMDDMYNDVVNIIIELKK